MAKRIFYTHGESPSDPTIDSDEYTAQIPYTEEIYKAIVYLDGSYSAVTTVDFKNNVVQPGEMTFTASGNLIVPPGLSKVQVLVIGGGGGGGGHTSYGGGGGGGAGGAVYSGSVDVSDKQSIQVTVGSGGQARNNGQSSSFASTIPVVADGGGKGADALGVAGFAGGCGGGGSGIGSGSATLGGVGSVGFSGGKGGVNSGNPAGGGGGGIGSAGVNGSSDIAGNGGTGITSIGTFTGVYCGGGGGSLWNGSGSNGTGGSSIGGSGGWPTGGSGAVNTGSGGGAGRDPGSGGSGIVIVKWPDVSGPIAPTDYIAYWKFDGNTNDATGLFNLANSGAVKAAGRTGFADTCYSFDGVDDYMLKQSANLGLNGKTEFTVSFWINSNDTSGRIIQKQISDGWSTFYASIDSGIISVSPQNQSLGQYPTWATTLAISGWKKVTFTFKKNLANSSDGLIYIGGDQVTTTFTSNGYSSNFSMQEDSNNLYLGVRPVSLTYNLLGLLQDIKIFGRQLTQSEVVLI